MRKSWENHEKVTKKVIRKSRGIPDKFMRNLWKSHNKVMRKSWECVGKVTGKSWESDEKILISHVKV